ncbi:MFS transporter [Cellulomonas chengniuliangii]|uniref:MFS transporter n=1 Tax=Cellulomonas chengniuliangii TaxID=2968084 RepID=UPI001D0E62A6|nr:MFS transporter [Cellulomonas chengniuliangii]MCC2317764.1 MFS transporter [Cellulomonas chengniuliangii]
MTADPGGSRDPLLPAGARSARRAVAGAFGAQGLAYAVLVASLPGFKDRFGIDDGVVTIVTLGICLMAGAGTVVADRLARGPGSRTVLVAGLGTAAVAVLVIALAPGRAVFFGGFALYGLALGLVDAGTNMQAVALQRVYGRSILTSFYAAWSAAAIAGALVVVAYEALDISQQAAIPVVSVVVAVIALGVRRDGWRAGDVPIGPTAAERSAARAVPWSAVLVLGAAVVAYFVVDSAAQIWSAIYLSDGLLASSSLAPTGLAVYLAMTLVSRLAGDLAVRRWGRVAVVRAAGLIGAAGLLGVVLAPGPAVAVAGFGLTGLGLGAIAPLCFAAAGSLAPEHADAVVARLNGFNYVGAVLGGVLVGAVGTGASLRIGFAVPLLLAIVIVVLAPHFGTRPGSEDSRHARQRPLPPARAEW